MDEGQKANLRMSCVIEATKIKVSCPDIKRSCLELAKELSQFVIGENEG